MRNLTSSPTGRTEGLRLGADRPVAVTGKDCRYLALGQSVRVFDETLAVSAARLRTATRGKGLSLGDRACIAQGLREGRSVLAADRAWAGLHLGTDVTLIR